MAFFKGEFCTAVNKSIDPVITIGNKEKSFILVSMMSFEILEFIFSNIYQSLKLILSNYYNLLGEDGTLGAREYTLDTRNHTIQLFSDFLAAFIAWPILILTNGIDIIISAIPNLILSICYNILAGYNLVYSQDVDANYHDDRNKFTILLYGILTLPLILPVIIISTYCGLIFAFCENLFLSAKINILNHWHLLGKIGIFGDQEKIVDSRDCEIRMFFGLGTLPITLLITSMTNVIDFLGACTTNAVAIFSNTTEESIPVMIQNAML